MLPKKFNKMSIEEQEVHLTKKLSDLYKTEKYLRKALASVRNKVKVEVSEEERPDLAILKSEN
jgi:hypothetical protein